jgi:glucokinase
VTDRNAGKPVVDAASPSVPSVAAPPASRVVVGIDMGGTSVNVTVIDEKGSFLIGRLVETPSRVREGPLVAVGALAEALTVATQVAGISLDDVTAVGLGTPGPASATGVLSSHGATNFSEPAWWGFDLRGALEARLDLPVTYSNDANAAALYAHYAHFGADAPNRSSVAAIIGTGLGGGVIVGGATVTGHAGMAGELGHLPIPMDGILTDDQPIPRCNCGRAADAESVASLSGIQRNLLPYWVTRFPGHEVAGLPVAEGARRLRALAEAGDALALKVFEQQAQVIGRLFTILADVTDPDAYFVGGGVVEAVPSFRQWFVEHVESSLGVRAEQSRTVAVVADGDMAGARGAALAAWQAATPSDRPPSGPSGDSFGSRLKP